VVVVLNLREATLASIGNIHSLIKNIIGNGQRKTRYMDMEHNWEQKYIYLDNATDVTPYCICNKCGKDVDGWLEKVSKNKEECKGNNSE
jgi:hypothetical protein